MCHRALVAIVLLVTPAMADPRYFDDIRAKQVIMVLLPDAQCEAKVVSRDGDQLTLSLKKTTRSCGERNFKVILSRADVEDVMDERPPGRRSDRSPSQAGLCTVAGTVLVGISAGQYVGETTTGNGPGLAVIAAGGVASAALCYGVFFPRGPRYSVSTSHLTPAPAPAKHP